jgi:hypothetical protein
MESVNCEAELVEDLQAAIAQFVAVTRVKERPGFPIANDLKKVSQSEVLAGDGVQFLNCLIRQLKASAYL